MPLQQALDWTAHFGAKGSTIANHADALIPESQVVTVEQKIFLLGEATFLFLNSPLHLRYAVHQLPTFILTPLRLGQCRIYRSARGPVGFVAWAYLSAQVADDYVHQRRELTPEDWHSGDDLWFIEFIAPFGHARRIAADLRANVFPRAKALYLRRFTDGRPPTVVSWRGVEAAGDVAAIQEHDRGAASPK